MKVLMFGWEYPPHISGGLGTACFGLTHSLGKEKVDVLFVVPKLHGDEPSGKASLVSASNIYLGAKDLKRKSMASLPKNPESQSYDTTKSQSYDTPKSQSYGTTTGQKVVIQEEKGFTYIEVPSGITAYRSPEFEQAEYGIVHWSHEIMQEGTTRRPSPEPPPSATVVHPAAKVRPPDHANLPNVSVEESRGISYKFSGAYGTNLLSEVEKYAQIAAEIAKRFSFDVIHAHDWMTYPAGIAAQKVSGKPLVVHVHATEYDRAGERIDTRVHALEKEGMTKADCVVTVSEWTKNIAVTKYHIPEKKIKVVYNGIVLKRPGKIEFNSPLKHSPIVTFLGRVTQQKGPLYFVDAAKKVLDEIPDARFIVAGSGDLLPEMIKRVAHAGMSARFHFTGFLKGQDIERIWSISNVYVMPSVSEPFGITPLEAIQAGVPVIISKQSGIAEVMPHAITVDFWNTAALAESICSVLKYKSLYRTLKKNSKAEIKSVTWDKAAKTLNTLYHELIEQ